MDLVYNNPKIQAIDMDVGTVQSPAVNVTMPGQRQGRRFPQQNQAVSADGCPSALTADSAGHCPPLTRFLSCLSLRILHIQGFVMLRDPCLFLRKSHVTSENFGGINMDLSTVYRQPLNMP